MKQKVSYFRASFLSVMLHLLIAAVLVVSFTPDIEPMLANFVPSQEPIEIVRAVTVDAAKLEAEIASLKSAEVQKQDAERARLRELEQQMENARREREQEEARLNALKAQQAEQKRQAEAEMAALTEQRREEEKQLAQQRELAQQLAAEAEQAAIEAQRLREIDEAAAAAQRAEARAQTLQSETARYIAIIRQKVEDNWLRPPGSEVLSCQVLVRVMPTGEVFDAKVVQSSGSSAFDRSALAAVQKASPLPVPTDAELFESFRELNLPFRPAVS